MEFFKSNLEVNLDSEFSSLCYEEFLILKSTLFYLPVKELAAFFLLLVDCPLI